MIRKPFLFLLSCLLALTSCAEKTNPTPEGATPKTLHLPKKLPPPTQTESPQTKPKPTLIEGKYITKSTQSGKMSWYSVKTNGGTRTASGQRLSDSGLTAAHRTLPFGTRVRVTNLHNGKTAIMRITDRGPFTKGRIIDVSLAAGRQLDFIRRGVANCKIEVLGTP